MSNFRSAYNAGVSAYRNGIHENPYGNGNMMEMCAWSAGYFDAKRGMV